MGERGKKWLIEGYEWLQILSVLLVALVGCFAFLGNLATVDGSSMYPTLEHGDMLLVRRVACTPETGDVVILRAEHSYSGQPLVKRVIATGGQTVFIDYDANTVTVDGVVLEEHYLNFEDGDPMERHPWLMEAYANRAFTVPEGCVFVCGDNRNNSGDSRGSELGMVDQRYLMGEAVAVIWPFDRLDFVE